MPTERFFSDRSELTAALADEIARRVTTAVEARDAASLVLTGGSTPAPLYQALAGLPAPWDKATVTLSDERWVDAPDPASNEGMIRGSLLTGTAAGARLVGLKTAAASPTEAVADVEAAVATMHTPFDVVVLGMGEDGHVASLFPHAAELAVGLDVSRPDLVCAVNRPDARGAAERISLTLRALLNSRYIAILILGEAKRDALRRIADDDVAGAPINAILRQSEVPVDIWWAP
jgi:6-phosphogluconolactonase